MPIRAILQRAEVAIDVTKDWHGTGRPTNKFMPHFGSDFGDVILSKRVECTSSKIYDLDKLKCFPSPNFFAGFERTKLPSGALPLVMILISF